MLDGVDPHFANQWTGPIQAVFDMSPIPEFINDIKKRLICTAPISAPFTNPPLAFAQHKVLPPGDQGKVVAERLDSYRHIADAMSKPIPTAKQEDREAVDLIAAIKFVCDHEDTPSALVKARQSILAEMRVMQTKLLRHNSMLRSMQPRTVNDLAKHVPMDICILYILNCAVGSPDFYYPHAFVTGFPMIGYLHRTGVYRQGGHQRTDWQDEFEEWNRSLINSIRKRAMKSQDKQGLRECYEATIKECSMGLMEGPYTYKGVCKALPGSNICAMRRFPQYRYPGAPCRPCDHGGEGANNRFASPDKLVTENSEFPLRSAIIFRDKLTKQHAFRLSTNDLKKAYRQMPSGHPHHTVVALWNPAPRAEGGQVVEFFIDRGMPFGLATSVLQFNRPMESLVAILRRVFGVPCAHYYDDIVNAGPAFAAKSDDDVTRALCAIIGFVLDDDKWCKPNVSNAFLGVIFDFSQYKRGLVFIRIKPERKKR